MGAFPQLSAIKALGAREASLDNEEENAVKWVHRAAFRAIDSRESSNFEVPIAPMTGLMSRAIALPPDSAPRNRNCIAAGLVDPSRIRGARNSDCCPVLCPRFHRVLY